MVYCPCGAIEGKGLRRHNARFHRRIYGYSSENSSCAIWRPFGAAFVAWRERNFPRFARSAMERSDLLRGAALLSSSSWRRVGRRRVGRRRVGWCRVGWRRVQPIPPGEHPRQRGRGGRSRAVFGVPVLLVPLQIQASVKRPPGPEAGGAKGGGGAKSRCRCSRAAAPGRGGAQVDAGQPGRDAALWPWNGWPAPMEWRTGFQTLPTAELPSEPLAVTLATAETLPVLWNPSIARVLRIL